MTKNKKTVVLGATSKPEKYAFKAISLLVEKGHSVIAIGQNAGEVAGVKIKTKAIPLKNIDTITLYLNPARQRDYYNYIVEAKPKRVVFNPGTENPELYQLLELNGIQAFFRNCELGMGIGCSALALHFMPFAPPT